jgi:hypothetical protein
LTLILGSSDKHERQNDKVTHAIGIAIGIAIALVLRALLRRAIITASGN